MTRPTSQSTNNQFDDWFLETHGGTEAAYWEELDPEEFSGEDE